MNEDDEFCIIHINQMQSVVFRLEPTEEIEGVKIRNLNYSFLTGVLELTVFRTPNQDSKTEKTKGFNNPVVKLQTQGRGLWSVIRLSKH